VTDFISLSSHKYRRARIEPTQKFIIVGAVVIWQLGICQTATK